MIPGLKMPPKRAAVSARVRAPPVVRESTRSGGVSVVSVGTITNKREVLENLTSILFEGKANSTLTSAIQECAWLNIEDPALVALLCEIKDSLAISEKATLISLSAVTSNPEDVYWLLASMRPHEQKFTEHVEAEFSAEGSIKTDQVCPKCKQQWWYIIITRPASGDEAEVVNISCATCKPKT